jgi:hypothetical protein
VEAKVMLAEKNRQKYGLNRCLRALGLSKGTWHRRQHRPAAPEKDRDLKGQVLTVVQDHPAYGYRRIGVELRERTGVRVNHKRLRRVLNLWDLALSRKVARPRPSGVRRILRTGRGKLDLEEQLTVVGYRLTVDGQRMMESGRRGGRWGRARTAPWPCGAGRK